MLLAIVVIPLVMAAPATAGPIGQILINGAAPNADGTGLQVSANFAGGFLKVTNESSSYTDIQTITGSINPTSAPLTAATTKAADSATCTVTGGSSFSCPGLSIAPGANVAILLQGGVDYPNAGLANLNVVYDSIEVNGTPMNPHGSGLQVTAITTQGSCPELGKASAWCLTVTNSPTDGTSMTEITALPNLAPADESASQVSDINAGFGFGFGSDTLGCDLEQGGFGCLAPFGVSPQEYGFAFSNPSFTGGLGDIQVSFQSTPCADTAVARVAPALDSATAHCTPPAHTKITVAKINQTTHTALFDFTAKGTRKFTCELVRNGLRLYYAPCHSPKPYATKLTPGKYVFYVDGTNQAGADPHPAEKKFTLQ